MSAGAAVHSAHDDAKTRDLYVCTKCGSDSCIVTVNEASVECCRCQKMDGNSFCFGCVNGMLEGYKRTRDSVMLLVEQEAASATALGEELQRAREVEAVFATNAMQARTWLQQAHARVQAVEALPFDDPAEALTMSQQNKAMLVRNKRKLDEAEMNVSVVFVCSCFFFAMCARLGAHDVDILSVLLRVVCRSQLREHEATREALERRNRVAEVRSRRMETQVSRMMNKGARWHAYIEEPRAMQLEDLGSGDVIKHVLAVLNKSCHADELGRSVCNARIRDSFDVTGVTRIMNTSLLWPYKGKYEQAKFVADHVDTTTSLLDGFGTDKLGVYTQIGWGLDKHVNECCLLHGVRGGEETALLIAQHGFDRHLSLIHI